MHIGVISDTHGLLRPEALAALQESELILHAGDIGKPEILEQLAAIAPVHAVRGNNDQLPWAQEIPERQILTLEGVRIFMLHDVKELSEEERRTADVIVSGHSHKPRIEQQDEMLFLNPGSAGQRRFSLPISVALLEVAAGRAVAEIVELDTGKK